jgi:hypothetical protein
MDIINEHYSSTYNVLAHHGILGQKWGVRRYQNKDGTYTVAGKKRYRASKEEQAKSQQVIDDAHKYMGEEASKKATENEKKHLDYLTSVDKKQYQKDILGYDDEDGLWENLEEMYDDDLEETKHNVGLGKYAIKNARIMEQKLNEIDTKSTRYEDVEKYVDDLLKEMVGTSNAEYEKDKRKNS